MPLVQKSIVPPSPRSPSPTRAFGLKVLDVQAGLLAVALPALAQRLQQPGGAAQERLALAPVGAQLVELCPAVNRPCSPVQPLVQPVARMLGGQLAQLAAEDDVLLGARAVHVDDVLQASPRARSQRSMLMIGVMPLPALMNSSRRGQRVGQHERAFDAAQAHDRPRAHARRGTARPCRPRRASG